MLSLIKKDDKDIPIFYQIFMVCAEDAIHDKKKKIVVIVKVTVVVAITTTIIVIIKTMKRGKEYGYVTI